MTVLIVVARILTIVFAGVLGAALFHMVRARREEKLVRDLPREIREALEVCELCVGSALVCKDHPRRAFEDCGCGGVPVPCPRCRADCWNVLELLEEIERLKSGSAW